MIQFDESYRDWGKITLDDKQVDGINFLLTHPSGLLCFQTGLGKTITSMVASKILVDNFSSVMVLVVMPVKALKSFRDTLFGIMGLTRKEVGIISTGDLNYDLQSNRWLLVTDTNIGKYPIVSDMLEKPDSKLLLIIDEAHKLADKKSKFHTTMKSVKSRATITWSVTATPLINDLDGLYNIVNFTCPGFLGKKTDFDNRYTKWHLESIYVKGGQKKKIKVLDGYKNLSELQQKLKQVMIVRSKVYNLKFSKQFQDLTDEEKIVYEKVSSGLLSKGSDERNFSKRMHDLQRFIDRAYDGDEEIVDLTKQYSKNMYSTKEQLLLDTLKVALSDKHSIIIYADYKDTVERLHKVLKSKRVELNLGRIYEITGSIDIKTRESVEDRINQNDVIIITSAGTESINLQRCDSVIFYDIPFSSKQLIQCIGRVCRTDTKHSAQYIVFCGTNDTIDEYKYLLFQNHLDMIQKSINVGTEIPLENLDIDNAHLKELREKLLWKYKGDPIKKKLRKDKREMKKKIKVSNLKDAVSIMACNKFLIEPLEPFHPEIKEVKVLYPDETEYSEYLSGKIPYTVLRAHYLDKLRSDRGKELVKGLQKGIMNSAGDFLIVGNTKLNEVLMQEILDQFVI